MIGFDYPGTDIALKALTSANAALQQTMNQASTGKRVATVEDDPASWVVASRLDSDRSATQAVSLRLSAAEIPTRVAATALNNISNTLLDIKNAAIEATSGDDAQAAEAVRIQDLLSEISNNVEDATMNGVNLIAGAVQGAVQATQIKVPSGLSGPTMTIGDKGLSTMNASLAGLGLDGFVTSADGVDIQFPALSAEAISTAPPPTQLVIQTANYGNPATQIPQYPGQKWTFQFTDAASPSAAAQTELQVDAQGNVLQQDNVLPVPLNTGFTLTDALKALQTALAGAGFVTQVSQQALQGQPAWSAVTVNIAGNNIDTNPASSVVSNLRPNDPPAVMELPVRMTAATSSGGTTLTIGSSSLPVPAGSAFADYTNAQFLSTSTDVANYLASNPTAPAFVLSSSAWSPTPVSNPAISAGTTITSVNAIPHTATSAITLSSAVTAGIPSGQYVWLLMPVNAAASVAAWTGPDATIATLDSAINKAGAMAQTLGNVQNAITSTQARLSQSVDALSTGIGALTDANMDKVSAELVAQQIRQQLATQSLSIADHAPSLLLQLFQH